MMMVTMMVTMMDSDADDCNNDDGNDDGNDDDGNDDDDGNYDDGNDDGNNDDGNDGNKTKRGVGPGLASTHGAPRGWPRPQSSGHRTIKNELINIRLYICMHVV